MAIKKYLNLDGFKYFVEKIIGKTDISKIGDGTIKGAVSELNNSLEYYAGNKYTSFQGNVIESGEIFVEKKNGICYINGYLMPKATISDNTTLLTGLPKPRFITSEYIPTFNISPSFNRNLYINVTSNGQLACRYGSNIKYYLNASYPYVE